MPGMTAVDRFRSEFRRLVAAHNEAKGFATNPEALLDLLAHRIGQNRLVRIGSAYLNRWLQTEDDQDCGYFVREADRPGLHGGQVTLTNQGQGQVAPCWELFVQLADYAWLRTIAARRRHAVRLEDRLMDLTVRAGSTLILYVEQKVTRDAAERLLKG